MNAVNLAAASLLGLMAAFFEVDQPDVQISEPTAQSRMSENVSNDHEIVHLVPEPSSVWLTVLGVSAFLAAHRRR